MGSRSLKSSSNYWNTKRKFEESFFYTIHRARVTAVHVSKGTVEVSIDGNAYEREVVIPLLGLSFPPDQQGQKDPRKTSWGRYIPQEGDLLLVAFDTDGEIYALGYSAIYYGGFGILDDSREDRGGVGWSSASGKNIKPGDWDFKSSRNCGFYMGNKIVLNSGPITTTIDKGQNFISNKAGLVHETVGEASDIRKGVGRRFVLPTDAEETEIPSPRGTTCQEITETVNYSVLGVPRELAKRSIGDVIDEDLLTPKLSSVAKQPVRLYESYKDNTGSLVVSETEIDTVGNFYQASNTALVYQWATDLATWEINNAITNLKSSASVLIDSPSVIVDAPNIQLGSAAATSFAVKGTELISALGSFCTALNIAAANGASISSTPPLTPLATPWANVAQAALTLQTALNTVLATKVKVE